MTDGKLPTGPRRKGLGADFAGLLTVVFIGLKLGPPDWPVASWSWWMVISPIYAYVAVQTFLFFLVIGLKLLERRMDRKAKERQALAALLKVVAAQARASQPGVRRVQSQRTDR